MARRIESFAPYMIHAFDWVTTDHQQLDEAEANDLRPVECWIVGHVLNDTDDYITLASHYFVGEGGTHSYRHAVAIPKGCIIAAYPLQIQARGHYSAEAQEK